jgi:hypothetical protein
MPFEYPTAAHARIHGPKGYTNYKSFKPWLRDEFVFHCVYCLERERWSIYGASSFSVDHVKAKVDYPELKCDYENLIYACVRCNSWKNDTEELPDPTQTPYGNLIEIRNGRAVAIDPLGRVIIDHLHLDEDPVVTTRRKMNNLIQAWLKYPDDDKIAEMFFDHFSFPDDLPRLDNRRVENSRPAGVSQSHRARKNAGTLPDIY